MEITANAVQTVNTNSNVVFTDVTVASNKPCIIYREGSGLVTLRGLTQGQSRALFKVTFGANVAIPTGGTLVPITLTAAVNGESIAETNMIFTPAATGVYGHINSSVIIAVPSCCCSQLSIKNLTTVPTEVQNANLIVERIA